MGKRAAVASIEKEVSALTLSALNGQIAHAKWGYENGRFLARSEDILQAVDLVGSPT